MTTTDELMLLSAVCTANFGNEDGYVKARAALRAAIEEVVSAAEMDAKRLEWVMHRVSGVQWQRLGVHYGAGCDRDAIDAAIRNTASRSGG